ncbi:MAG TPA: redoxin domain-containing protein [Aurantimonas coralicida]|uniref:Redoxin domain-containing protein n=2 Tax=root TaxID=1 RepID=A0A9C9TG49_9HYPH|nr:redoxin domain-containing protein [Aurantimonas coralicida]HET99956.1 redoxin domain-containing protein [Aurantimonas coralicida]
MHAKPEAGGLLPQISFPKFGGGTLSVGGARARHTLFVVYRGKHCGRCKKYLAGLEAQQADWHAAGFDIVVVSADPLTKVQADIDQFGWTFDLGYDLSEPQMRQLGVYISDPLSPEETDRRFAEPAVFCVRPDGVIQVVCLSNGPAARPDLSELLDGIKFNIAHSRPARGTA